MDAPLPPPGKHRLLRAPGAHRDTNYSLPSLQRKWTRKAKSFQRQPRNHREAPNIWKASCKHFPFATSPVTSSTGLQLKERLLLCLSCLPISSPDGGAPAQCFTGEGASPARGGAVIPTPALRANYVPQMTPSCRDSREWSWPSGVRGLDTRMNYSFELVS